MTSEQAQGPTFDAPTPGRFAAIVGDAASKSGPIHIDMVTNPAYQAITHHRSAALADSRLILTEIDQ